MLETLQNLDWSVLVWTQNALRSDWADAFFPWITSLNKNPLVLVLLLVSWIFQVRRKFSTKKTLGLFLFLILAVAMTDFLGTQIFKNNIPRLRPFEAHPLLIPMVNAVGPSFISNHSANTACLAFFLSSFLGISSALVLGLLAFAVGVSRVYCGVHYPTDVMAGWAWGCLMAFLFVKLFLWAENKLASRSETGKESV